MRTAPLLRMPPPLRATAVVSGLLAPSMPAGPCWTARPDLAGVLESELASTAYSCGGPAGFGVSALYNRNIFGAFRTGTPANYMPLHVNSTVTLENRSVTAAMRPLRYST